MNDDDTTNDWHALVETDENEGFEPRYSSVEHWLKEWLLPTAGPRSTRGENYWCEQWWRHPDVVGRLTALWLAWEHANHDPTDNDSEHSYAYDNLPNRSHWWVYHWQGHRDHIFGASSSMVSCGNGHQRIPTPLKAEPLGTVLQVVS